MVGKIKPIDLKTHGIEMIICITVGLTGKYFPSHSL